MQSAEPGAEEETLRRPRRRPLACQRCRRRKVKCDTLLPSCSNCIKADVPCEEVQGSDRSHTQQLVARIEWLESIVRSVAPNIPIEPDGDYELPALQSQQQSVTTGDEFNFPPPTAQTGLTPYVFDQDPQPTYPESAIGTEPVAATNNHVDSTPRANGPSPITPSAASHISAEQPLAQSVGLISLRHSSDPKYLGPSSGVSFARLIFAAAPPSQGLPAFSGPFNASQHVGHEHATNNTLEATIAPLPPITEVSHFVAAYVDAFHHMYPFLGEGTLDNIVDQVANSNSDGKEDAAGTVISSLDRVILYLVIALGARTLESQMKTEFSSSKYLDTAMDLMGRVQLYENIKGVQIMLLLALATFIFPTAPNAWFLVSTIIASCVDLGLQRKNALPQASEAEVAEQNIRRGVFWSAYSLDRTLCTTLGRPLTLRDEAIDIEYPGAEGSDEIYLSGLHAVNATSPPQVRDAIASPDNLTKRRRIGDVQRYSCAPSIISFRFDRIVAEIKLMIYRVVQIPERFPWPIDHANWQQEAHQALQSLLSEARWSLKPNRLFHRGTFSDQTLPTLELKYHHCVTLLFRPSPAFPRPTTEALRICYESASETIRIHAELLRFGRLNDSWLAAHTVFVSGITMLYYAWVNPLVLKTASEEFYRRQKSCSEVLGALGRTWSVAKDARDKFDKLIDMTKNARADIVRNNDSVNPIPSRSGNTGIGSLPNNSSNQASNVATAETFDEAQFDASWDAPFALWDELGDMRSWFDLEWFGEPVSWESAGDATVPNPRA